MVNHPRPEHAVIVFARDLKVGMYLYCANTWFRGPEETRGCWRRIVSIKVAEDNSDRDLRVEPEIFAGETAPLTRWFDNHTLVIVKKS